jgi:hypothetical protein
LKHSTAARHPDLADLPGVHLLAGIRPGADSRDFGHCSRASPGR